MSNLQDEQAPLDDEIAGALIDNLPEGWLAAELEVSVTGSGDGQRIEHVIRAPNGRTDLVLVPEEIRQATSKLLKLFKRYGRGWKRVTYRVAEQPDGNWRFVADFEY